MRIRRAKPPWEEDAALKIRMQMAELIAVDSSFWTYMCSDHPGDPFHRVPISALINGSLIVDEVMQLWGLVDSLSEVKRLCRQGGVKINGRVCKDPKKVLTVADLGLMNETLVIKLAKGKKAATHLIFDDVTPEELLVHTPDPVAVSTKLDER